MQWLGFVTGATEPTRSPKLDATNLHPAPGTGYTLGYE